MTSQDFHMNMEAVAKYFARIPPKTSKARNVKDAYIRWKDSLGWWDLAMNQSELWDKARNFKTRYDMANARTQSEKDAAERQRLGGLTTEEIEDKARRTKASGLFVESKGDLIAGRLKYPIYIIGTLLIAGYGFLKFSPARGIKREIKRMLKK